MEVSYGRWNRWEKRYSIIRCLGCQQPILALLPLTSGASAECEQRQSKQVDAINLTSSLFGWAQCSIFFIASPFSSRKERK